MITDYQQLPAAVAGVGAEQVVISNVVESPYGSEV